MINSENKIGQLVRTIEAEATQHFYEKFRGTTKPPAIDHFKASFMAEVARRIKARAIAINEDTE